MNNSSFNFNSTSYGNTSSTSIHYDVDGMLEEYDEEMDLDDENGNNELMFAVCQGKEDVVRAFIDQGAFVDHQNIRGETALFWASTLGFIALVELLLENGANPNIVDIDGVSPLHQACSKGHLAIVRLLATRGAFINSQDEEADTCLHYAVRGKQVDVVRFLVQELKSIHFNLLNEDGESPLELANCLLESEPLCPKYATMIQILSTSSPSVPVSFEKIQSNNGVQRQQPTEIKKVFPDNQQQFHQVQQSQLIY